MRNRSFSAFVVCVLGLAACSHPRAIVLAPNAPHGVRVNGVGEASAPPDIARTRLGIELRSATAEQASDEASQRMAALIAALKQLGIADKDLRTYNYAVTFEAEQQPTPPAPAGVKGAQPSAAETRGSYHVSNMLEVTVRDMKSIGKVMQVAGAAGANNFWGLTFDLEDDSALVTRARALAVADAQRAAAELAKLTGVQLGEIVSLSEAEAPNLAGPPVYARTEAVSDVPIERGEVTVRYGVQLVYAVASP